MRHAPDAEGYSVYCWGHLDFPDEYKKVKCGMVVHCDEVDDHDKTEPCERCSPQ